MNIIYFDFDDLSACPVEETARTPRTAGITGWPRVPSDHDDDDGDDDDDDGRRLVRTGIVSELATRTGARRAGERETTMQRQQQVSVIVDAPPQAKSIHRRCAYNNVIGIEQRSVVVVRLCPMTLREHSVRQ